MRRFFAGLAILALVGLVPQSVRADDREIAQQILQTLKEHRDAGRLKGFTLDMKVENGVVLFKGQVTDPAQRAAVLGAADGLAGVEKVVDQIALTSPSNVPVNAEQVAATEGVIAQASPATESSEGFSLRRALQSISPVGFNDGAIPQSDPMPQSLAASPVMSGPSDNSIRDAIVASMSQAKRNGQLSGFGVNVNVRGGAVNLNGKVRSDATREQLINLARHVPGVRSIPEDIVVEAVQPVAHLSQNMPAMNQNMPDMVPTAQVSPVPAMAAPVAYGNPGMQMPQAMYPSPGCNAGGPRYDGPNLPNYAWPGYASYPNYAALTYPQQYSPSAWPYIGPFYPYPQVPLGWRKVSLEWDDGSWMLDFSDK